MDHGSGSDDRLRAAVGCMGGWVGRGEEGNEGNEEAEGTEEGNGRGKKRKEVEQKEAKGWREN